ncbi:MAG TPA: DUF2206 domain-containing protein [Candidatus Saccharimonadales bacterium]|nr:DUF2206 domain-containing protein [Candidatus Saccharimonadales bacterium]
MVLPVLSLLGVMQLNNGGKGFFAVTNLIAILMYEAYFFRSKRTKSDLEIGANLFFVTLSLALSYSMRSNFVVGYDVSQEFQVFSSVVRNGLWESHLFNSTYSACLSITVLPALLKTILTFSSQYIFKFVMQLVLCIVPIAVYLIAKKQIKNTSLALVAALFFIFQAQFMFEFPALVRQQCALLFFGLIFVASSSENLSSFAKKTLVLVFGVGMVVSHYSTAYVCLAFLAIYTISKLILGNITYYKTGINSGKSRATTWVLTPLALVILFLFAFFWYGETLQSTGGVTQKLYQSVTSFDTFFSADSRSSFISQDLHIGSQNSNDDTLNSLENASAKKGSYGQAASQQSNIYPTSQSAPQVNSKLQLVTEDMVNLIMPTLLKVVIVVGAAAMVVGSVMKRRIIDDGLFVLSAGMLFLLLVILPTLSQDYNLQRLYQQLLIIVSASFVVGVQVLLTKWRQATLGVSVVLALLYFVTTSNLVSQLAFGRSDINLSNSGLGYDKFYLSDDEASSLNWLQDVYMSPLPVNLDTYGKLHAESITTLNNSRLIQGMLPTELYKDGYVYATNTNINKNLVFDTYGNQEVTYNFPAQFLSQRKNLIYSNKDSEIYR